MSRRDPGTQARGGRHRAEAARLPHRARLHSDSALATAHSPLPTSWAPGLSWRTVDQTVGSGRPPTTHGHPGPRPSTLPYPPEYSALPARPDEVPAGRSVARPHTLKATHRTCSVRAVNAPWKLGVCTGTLNELPTSFSLVLLSHGPARPQLGSCRPEQQVYLTMPSQPCPLSLPQGTGGARPGPQWPGSSRGSENQRRRGTVQAGTPTGGTPSPGRTSTKPHGEEALASERPELRQEPTRSGVSTGAAAR